ncbi:MAG: cadherin-like beta sandwich domain-containing protein [Lentihominibacter sp.]
MEGKRRLKHYFAWLLVLSLAFTMSFSNLAFATEGDPVDSETPAVTETTGTEVQLDVTTDGSSGGSDETPAEQTTVEGKDEGGGTTYPVIIGSGGYATLADAVQSAGAGAVIEVNEDIELTSTVEINKSMTIDIGVNNITAKDCRAFHVKNGTLTIMGEGTVSSEHVTSDDFPVSSSVIRVGDNDVEAGSKAGLIIDEGVLVTSNYCYGVTVFGSKTKEVVTIDGGVRTTGDAPALSGNGSVGYGDTDITVNGSVSSSKSYAIYHPQSGTLKINNTVEGGIEAKAGTVILDEEAWITPIDGVEPTHVANSDGCSTSGYAVALVEHSSYAGSPSLVVKDGVVDGEIAIIADNEVDESKKASITITGGTFAQDVSEYIDAESYKCIEDEAGWYVEPLEVACIEDTIYPTIQKAVNAAEEGDTITVLDDVELTGPVTIDKSVTIDLTTVGIKAVDCRAFHIKKGTVEFTGDGTISADRSGDDSAFESANSVIRLGDNSVEADSTAKLIIGEDIEVTSNHCYGISVFGKNTKETVVIDGTVAVTGEAPAVSGNGSNGYDGTVITVNGTVSAQNDNAIYQPQDGELTINGTVDGGIEAKAGTITIDNENAAVINNKAEKSHNKNGNGCSTLGYAVALVEHSSYAGSPELIISNGEVTGTVAVLEDNEVAADKKASITITGGIFSESVEKLIDTVEYRCTKLSDDRYQVTAKAVAKVNGETYRTLQAAVDAADEGDTVKINEDIEITAPVAVDKTLTIDMGGKSIEAVDNRAFHIKKGDVTFTGKGTVASNISGPDSAFESAYSVIRVGDNDAEAKSKAGLTIGKDVEVASNHCYGISVFGKSTTGTVVIDGTVAVTGEEPAISGNGSSVYKDTTIAVNGTVSAKNDNAIYHPQAGKLTINGTVEGGIEAKAGTITINDTAVVKKNSAEAVHNVNGDGCSTLGYAVALVEHKSYAGEAALYINGGKITGEVEILKDNDVEEGKEATIEISGGYFTEPVDYLISSKTLIESDIDDYVYMVAEKKQNVDIIPQKAEISVDTGDYDVPEELSEGIRVEEDVLDAAIRTAANSIDIPEEAKKASRILITPYLNIEVVDYDAEKAVCVLDIKPVYRLTAVINGIEVEVGSVEEFEVNKPITITMPAPFDIGDKEQITVKHTKDNGDLYYYPAAVTKQTEGTMISFVVTNGFSEFTFMVNSDDARISEIDLGEGIEVTKSESSNFVYEANVEPDVESVSLSVKGTDTKADVRVLVGGSEFKDNELKLETGLNEAFILVIAENDTCNLYTLKINKRAKSDNANLAGIALSEGSLSPAFAADKTDYTVSVANGIDKITVTPEVAESHAKAEVNGEADKAEAALKEGRNAVEIKVTAENGTEKTYKLTVLRLAKVGGIYKYGSLNYKVKTAAGGTGTVEVTGYSGNGLTSVKVPDTIKISDISYKVTAVGYRAFYGKTKLKYVTVGNNVSTIGISAFAKCTALKTATLGTGITSIGSYAFSKDTKLTTLIVKSGKLKTVGKGALNKVKKVKIKVPKAKVKTYKKLFKGKKAKKYTVVKL